MPTETRPSRKDYTYDPLGNLTRKSVHATAPVTDHYISNAANQLLEVRRGSATGTLRMAFVYDANGSLIKKAEGGTVTRTDTDAPAASSPPWPTTA